MQKINSQKKLTGFTRLAITTVIALTVSCAHQGPVGEKGSLGYLQSLSYEEKANPSFGAIGQLRNKALKDTAMSLGAQGGLAWSSSEINARLMKDKWYLETIYNFNGMMLPHGVLPPVLVEGNNSLNLDDPNTIRIAEKTYQIIEQARFATTPPNWREYLWMGYSTPEEPNKLLLPKNADERAVWKTYIEKGWQKGVEQSYSIFKQNLARLKRDYQGMALYRKLLQQNMISPPEIMKTELGITGSGDDMRVNDQILRITTPSKLNTQGKNWQAIVVKKPT